MTKTLRLAGKTAIVTGASQGLGEHLARELAREGARVLITARNHERLKDLRRRIERDGGIALEVTADLQRKEDCQAVIDRARSAFGGVDIIVLNAGSATFGKLEELKSFDAVDRAIATNFFGAAYPTFLALEHLVASQGVIAYVTSGSGHLPMTGYLGYCTSKHAMNGFFESLRLEMYPHGVSVLTINPGEMYSDDGAGRTVIGPEAAEHKVNLSFRRDGDVRRRPASAVATQCLEAIVERRRELDLSARPEKIATLLRPLLPELVDRKIYGRTVRMRAAFTSDRNQDR